MTGRNFGKGKDFGRIGWACAPALVLIALLARPIWDVDIFWQLRLGEMILAAKGPVWAEPFAALHQGEALVPLAWAGQALYAVLRLAWGWEGLRLADAAIWLGGFAIATASARRAGPGALAVALILAVIAALPLASIRPQSLAVLCFGLALVLWRSAASNARVLPLAGLLFIGWQNLHPSVSVAALTFGAAAMPGWLGWWKRRGQPPPARETALAGMAALAQAATPAGLDIMAISTRNAAASQAMGVSEWLPLWASVNAQNALPVALLAAAIGWAFVRRRGARAADWPRLAMVAALLVAAVLAYRFALFFALASAPLLAELLSGARDATRPHHAPGLALAALALLAAPLALPARFHPALPLAALDSLRATGLQGTLFIHFPWGGPAIDRGWPRWKMAFDGRYYRYADAEWLAYRQAATGRMALDEVQRRWNPAAFVLNPAMEGGLIARLRRSPAWREVPQQGQATVFIAAGPTTRP